jgi:hypothetical protein
MWPYYMNVVQQLKFPLLCFASVLRYQDPSVVGINYNYYPYFILNGYQMFYNFMEGYLDFLEPESR